MQRIAFIGAGKISRCLVGGLLRNGYAPDLIRVSDKRKESLDSLAELSPDLAVFSSNAAAATDCALAVVCVKPPEARGVCEEIGAQLRAAGATLVSVAAGVNLEMLDRWAGGPLAVIRCMPNTPALVGAGMSALCANAATSEAQRRNAEQLFGAVGETLWLDNEQHMPLATALSGCGPAYFFRVMEALERAAKNNGLSPAIARRLVLQTALGSAQLAGASGDSLPGLYAAVASKGGAAEQGLRALDEGGIDALFQRALNAAAARAAAIERELGDN